MIERWSWRRGLAPIAVHSDSRHPSELYGWSSGRKRGARLAGWVT